MKVSFIFILAIGFAHGQKTLFEQLWDNAQSKAAQAAALNTDFIKGIKAGTLNPENYGGYMVQDVQYLADQRDHFKSLADKEADPTLETFYQKKYTNFIGYTQAAKDLWYIQNENGIKVGTALKTYLDYYQKIATDNKSIYFAVATLPCTCLWGWLANQIKPEAPTTGVYYQIWIEANAPYDCTQSPSSTVNLVNDYYNKGLIDMDVAQTIFNTNMQNEVAFFKSATAATMDKDEL